MPCMILYVSVCNTQLSLDLKIVSMRHICHPIGLGFLLFVLYIYIYIDIYIYIYISISSAAQGGGGSFKNRKPIGEVGCCESGMAERIH